MPLVVEGSGAALPRNTWMFGGALTIHLKVLRPVPVEGWNVKQSGALRDAVREIIVSELALLRRASNDPTETRS